jgi:type IV secretory pathway VirJ component
MAGDRRWSVFCATLALGASWSAGAAHGHVLAQDAAAVPAAGGTATHSVLPLPANATRVSHGRFRDLPVYSPAGKPQSFVLFLSGDGGWDLTAETLAQQLVQRGAMVVGIDTPRLRANFEADGDQCVFPDGDLENLSHFVQAYLHNPGYQLPMLVGVGSGASLAYAVLAQAPENTFASALTLDFCPTSGMTKPLCKGSGFDFTPGSDGRGMNFVPAKKLTSPWVAIRTPAHQSCPAAADEFVAHVRGAAGVTVPGATAALNAAFTTAFARLAATARVHAAPTPAALGDLPVIEIAPKPGSPPTDSVAIIMSGDGGWAGLDQDVAAALSAAGLPVVGLDSLRYFWTARTPEGLAADTDRMIRYYLAHYGKKRVLLIGYSQGADVLPFAVNRLPPATRADVALTAIMGMSEHALFEFHVSSWISDSNSGPATLPEVERINGMPVLCIYGEDESDSLCPKLDPSKVIVVKVKGGHHFDGNYAGLAQDIMGAAKR